MTATEDALIHAGEALARSIGHDPKHHCPKSSPAVPCLCGAGQQQAKALDDWQHLVADISAEEWREIL